MEITMWKKFLMKWINACNFFAKPLEDLDDFLVEEFFIEYLKQMQPKMTAEEATTNGQLERFLTVKYPELNFKTDSNGLIMRSDYVYVYSILLHHSFMDNDYFTIVLKDLPNVVSDVLQEFFDRMQGSHKFSHKSLTFVLAELTNVQPKVSKTASAHKRAGSPFITVGREQKATASIAEKNISEDELNAIVQLMKKTKAGECEAKTAGSSLNPADNGRAVANPFAIDLNAIEEDLAEMNAIYKHSKMSKEQNNRIDKFSQLKTDIQSFFDSLENMSESNNNKNTKTDSTIVVPSRFQLMGKSAIQDIGTFTPAELKFNEINKPEIGENTKAKNSNNEALNVEEIKQIDEHLNNDLVNSLTYEDFVNSKCFDYSTNSSDHLNGQNSEKDSTKTSLTTNEDIPKTFGNSFAEESPNVKISINSNLILKEPTHVVASSTRYAYENLDVNLSSPSLPDEDVSMKQDGNMDWNVDVSIADTPTGRSQNSNELFSFDDNINLNTEIQQLTVAVNSNEKDNKSLANQVIELTKKLVIEKTKTRNLNTQLRENRMVIDALKNECGKILKFENDQSDFLNSSQLKNAHQNIANLLDTYKKKFAHILTSKDNHLIALTSQMNKLIDENDELTEKLMLANLANDNQLQAFDELKKCLNETYMLIMENDSVKLQLVPQIEEIRERCLSESVLSSVVNDESLKPIWKEEEEGVMFEMEMQDEFKK